MRIRVGATICAAALLVAPAGAWAQVTIGANLARPATGNFDCTALPTVDAFGNRTFLPSTYVHGIFGGAPITSCTYLATQGLGGAGEIAQARGPGIVTQIAVRIGPTTGPMQVVVLRAIRSKITQSGGCCTLVGASQIFTPAPNNVTVVPVNLPMSVSISADADVGEAFDYLGLSVLAPGVPIPVQDLGTPGNVTLPGALAFFPAFGVQQPTRADGTGIGAVVPLLSATFVPCPGARIAQVGGGCPDRTPPALSALRLAGRTLSLRVSEPATIRIQLRRGSTTVRRLTKRATAAGTVRLKVPKAVRRGSYRASVTATDAAGNTSGALARTVSIAR